MTLNKNRILLTVFLFMILPTIHTFGNASSQRSDYSILRTFYVATNGNDKWSGTLSTPDPSGNDGPFATLGRARDTIRELRKKGSKGAFTVLVRGGVYELKETFVLEPEDSGTEANPLVFRAFENERPILCGTRTINNFVPYKDPILKADLTGIIRDSYPVKQVFMKGKRQIPARYPNLDPLDPIGGGFLYVEMSAEKGSKRKFIYKRADVREWDNPKDAEVFIFPGSNWANNIVTGFEIDRNAHTITLSRDASYEIKSGNRYFFQNVLEELDSPGEWYFYRQGKTLYYWPVNDGDLGEVSIPVLKSIVEIKGKKIASKYYGTPSYIRLEGFTFNGCEGSAIVVSAARGTVIARSTIHNAGGNGIEIQNGFENAAVGNDIFDIGGTGIEISAGDRKTLTPANNRAENNYIHDTGVFEKGGASGILCKGVGNVVSHNLIHSMPRVGIWLDGNDNLIEYNDIHHVNQETEDSGMIYFGQLDWTKRGNIVRFNYLHESGGFGQNNATGKWQTPFSTYGIYLDTWTSGTTIFGNIVTNTASGGIFIHGGRDNIIENNIIMEGGVFGQMVYSAYPLTHPDGQRFLPRMFAKIKEMGYTKYSLLSSINDVQTGSTMSGNSFVRNIVYYKHPSAILYGIYNDIDFSTTKSDHNVIYHAGLPLLVSSRWSPTRTPKDEWAAWRNRGLDRNSIVADPLFSDVVKEDFTLSPASPALKLGFQPIPINKIGPYKDPQRASWPIGK
jgi:parallel beta-helix repeat protein